MPHFNKRWDPMEMMFDMVRMMMGGRPKGKGKGKGKGKDGFGKHFKPEKAVWIGNLPEECTWKELNELGNQAGKCKWATTMRGGTGALIFEDAAAAEKALGLLNGAQVVDNTIEADK